jgi:diguanylate cyclase (GGDEF)-like protein
MTSLFTRAYLNTLKGNSGYFTEKIEDKTYLFSYLKLASPEGFLITSIPLASLPDMSTGISWTAIATILISAVIIFFIIIGVIWLVYKPFKEIVSAMVNFRRGNPDWSMRFKPYPIVELNTLSSWFNSYIENEHSHFKTEEALVDSERRYHSLFEDSPIPLWEEDFSEVLIGLDQLKLKGEALDEYLTGHPELVLRLISKLKISDVNQASVNQYKASSKQQMIDNTAHIFHNVNINLVRRELIQMANRTKIFELELENCTFDNDVLTIRMRWSVFPGYEETMGRVIVSTVDITREVKNELLRSTVMQITQETSSSETLNDLYKSIHWNLSKMMPAENLYIALYDDETGMVSFPYFVDQYDDPPPPHQFGNGWTEYVIRTGKPSLLSRDQVIKLQEEEGINNNGADSIDWLGVPLIVKDRTIGVLAVQTYEAGTRYTQEHCDWLTFVSTQIAMAIERKKAEEALKFSSTHDKLTGLYNRAYFEEEVNRLSAGRQNPVGVIIMDVDGLKRTNDTYGHSAGDDLLRATSRILMQAFRSNDMVARIGGDEFVVLLPYSTGLVVEKAEQRIDKFLVRYNHTNHTEVSLSIGTACTEEGISLTETIKMADQRMYEEKNRRRSQAILPNT